MSKSLEEIAIEESDFLTHITKPIRNFVYIDSDQSLNDMFQKIDAKNEIYAIDAERASGFKYSNRAYLLQISTKNSDIYLIDPVAIKDLTPLRQLLNNKYWILHAATQDLPCLQELELHPGKIFDTELAARLLSLTKVGLAGLLEEELAITLDKEHSAADWSVRPLPNDWLIYAALDVEFLHQLMDCLTIKLEKSNKIELAQQEFDNLLTWKSSAQRKDPWRKTSGMHDIKTGLDSAIVKELWEKRDEIAKLRDIAPGRILNDSAIIELALVKPKTVAELCELKNIKYRPSKNDAQIWFDCLQNAMKLNPDQWPVKSKNLETYPQPKTWQQKRPEAFKRLQFLKSSLLKLSEEKLIPVEHLCSPDLVKKWAWDSPTKDLSATSSWLISQGARRWQADLISTLMVQSLDNLEVDEFEVMQ